MMSTEVYFARIKDIAVAQFCKKHNLKLNEEEEQRVRDYIEIMQEDPIMWIRQDQEKEIILGYIKGLNIELYWKPQYSAELMMQLRECLEYDIPIVKILGRQSFCESDIRNIIIIKSSIILQRMLKELRKGREED